MPNGWLLPTRPISAPALTVGNGEPGAMRGVPAERARSLLLLDSCTSPVVVKPTCCPRRTRMPVLTHPLRAGTLNEPGPSIPGSSEVLVFVLVSTLPAPPRADGYPPR